MNNNGINDKCLQNGLQWDGINDVIQKQHKKKENKHFFL